jgi:hypothetical protein
VQGTAEQVRPLFPPGIATVQDGADGRDWVRVLIQAERLEWVPAVLAGIDRPVVIEGPDALRPLVRALIERLTAAVEPTTGPEQNVSSVRGGR